MHYIATDFYKNFKCIADSCPNTCCAGGWGIIIDELTYKKMIEKESQLGVPAKEWLIKREDYILAKQINKRCSMLNDNNLCNVVLKLGPEYLSDTCVTYPRGFHQYGSVIEVYLSMSCPAVVSTLMEKESIYFDFAENETPTSPYPYAELYLFESAVRTSIIDILQSNANVTLGTRLYASFNILDKAIHLYQTNQLDSDIFKANIDIYFQENTLLSLDTQLHNIVNEANRFAFIQQLQTIILENAYDDHTIQLATQTYNYFQHNNLEEYLSDIALFRTSIQKYNNFYTNYWVYHIFSDILEIPEYELTKEKLLYIALKFCCIQFIALASFSQNKNLDHNEYIYIISCISRIMEHNESFRKRLLAKLHENDLVSVAGLLLMTLV